VFPLLFLKIQPLFFEYEMSDFSVIGIFSKKL